MGAIGRGITMGGIGDRVISFHHIPCGTCFCCKNRCFLMSNKEPGLTGGFTPNGGGFGEYVKAMPWVAERGIVELPEHVVLRKRRFSSHQHHCEGGAGGG